MNGPHALVRERLEDRRRREGEASRSSDRLGNVRLVLALITVVLLILPLGVRASWPWWSLIPVTIVFLALGRKQDRVTKEERRLAAARRFYQEELDRLDERWRTSLADDGADLVPSDSLEARAGGDGGATPLLARAATSARLAAAQLAADLDLFGQASLYQLLSRSATPHGRRTLASWLLEAAPTATIAERQAAVRELAENLDWREALAVAARAEGDTPLADAALLRWGEKPEPLPAGALLRVAVIAEPLLLVASAGLFFAGGPVAPLAIFALIQIGTLLATRNAVAARAAILSGPDRSLSRYADLIQTIESSALRAEALQAIKRKLVVEGRPAAERIRELRHLVERLEYSTNMFFALSFGPLLMWDLQIVLAAERWQTMTGKRLRGWFEAIGEMEALASFGGLLHLRPDYALPEIAEEEGVFAARQLQHPLIDRRRVVGNDLELGGPGTVLLLSGSNMSGKSTLLRSIGINVVLAQAGAPCAAAQLRLSPTVLSTSIRVTDSLEQGTSHFYAELARIKATLDLARESGGQLLYLLDEMLHGTNSRERYIGAVSVIRWLSRQRAVGVVTTHDLSLARVVQELPPGCLVNRHFGDEVVGDEIRFDYHLREGPVQSTNALRLMRAIGIDIELSAPEGAAQ
ncbi:MAG: DNA mismatch repair protein MutS [Deltaproteobacteria bacterium]|nr:DNA mismatch repair protein MutS [Deltaproteobacteria bacterium]